MAAWLLTFLKIVPPVMPLVAWPVAARLVPKLKQIGEALYTTAYMLGFVDGFNTGLSLGLWIGTVSGAVATVLILAIGYWGFFKNVK
jgi:hypothetical protein